ncbi:hypothetical protein [Priestia flexa]|uniref:Uncharacterized protein n=1 Tax=Priestia flexa TaxID=86664 RepID=A0ABU4J260_9BACI|nr:hypothetical protein [Priestia flexa]MDW8515078.1 hypothetical protein [Priestia flexa]
MDKQQLLLLKQYQDRIDDLLKENKQLKRDYINVVRKMKKMRNKQKGEI